MEDRPFERRTEIVLGRGALARVPALVGDRVFLVTDPGVVAAGHAARLEILLRDAGAGVHCYDRSPPNPGEEDVEACLDAYRRASAGEAIQWIVALGGGSAIDTAKGCAMLACAGGRMADYVGRGKVDVVSPKLVAAPTTAGTGSETQSFALIGERGTGRKMACGGTAPVAAVLDPELTLTMPRHVTAASGLDALTHAVEAAVTRRRTAESAAVASEAFRMINGSFERVLAEPNDLNAREAMLHAAALAGLAIENSMLGAAHSMANPLTRHYGVVHGQAVGQVLPTVVAHNVHDHAVRRLYADFSRDNDVADRDATDKDAVRGLVARLRALVREAGFGPKVLGVPASAADELAAEAATQWTAQFNPVDVDVRDFERLYREVLS